jgi:hypothetical protein
MRSVSVRAPGEEDETDSKDTESAKTTKKEKGEIDVCLLFLPSFPLLALSFFSPYPHLLLLPLSFPIVPLHI